MDQETFAALPEETRKLIEHYMHIAEMFGPDKKKAVPIFEDTLRYPQKHVAELFRLTEAVVAAPDDDARAALIKEFASLRDAIHPITDAPEKIRLWPDGKIPTSTEYPESDTPRYNHDPDFIPYMVESLVPEDVTPKGAVIICAGGDHGESTYYEGYGVAKELNALGYQCFVLLNRTNRNPWSGQEVGADAARAIRIVRKNATKYRIPVDRVAFAGFSNGGLTGEANIAYYSGEQAVADHFPGYEPDELDSYYGAPDAFLNIYGARFAEDSFDYSKVVYPPTFMAVGREDDGIRNFNAAYPDLIAHGVDVEVHTFAATPHGVAGRATMVPGESYPGFQLWLPLADYFMQDAYKKRDGKEA